MSEQPRNDISVLTAAGIPAITAEFSCGCWGKHQPPYLSDDQIVFEIGTGYRSNKHTHGQNVYVIEADAEQHVALIEMRKYGDLYGAGLWHYLVGVDSAPFIAQVSSNIDTLAEALASLKPAEVVKAEAAGLTVQRQGDWFFVPVSRKPTSLAKPLAEWRAQTTRALYDERITLDGDHAPDEMLSTDWEVAQIRLQNAGSLRGLIIIPSGTIYVRGQIRHAQHTVLDLGDGWHKAIRNKAIRTGRLARGAGAD